MTEEELKLLIQELQKEGLGDYKIGKTIGWTRDQVRSFRRKNGIKDLDKVCIVCNSPLDKKRNTRYCSDECKAYFVIFNKAIKDAEVIKQWKV